MEKNFHSIELSKSYCDIVFNFIEQPWPVFIYSASGS